MTLSRRSSLVSAAMVAAAALAAAGFIGSADASFYYDEEYYTGSSIPCYAYDAYGHCTSYSRSRTARTRSNRRSFSDCRYRPGSYWYDDSRCERPIDNRYDRDEGCYWYYGNYRCERGRGSYYPYGYDSQFWY